MTDAQQTPTQPSQAQESISSDLLVAVGDQAFSLTLSRLLRETGNADPKTARFLMAHVETFGEHGIRALVLAATEAERRVVSLVKFAKRNDLSGIEAAHMVTDAKHIGSTPLEIAKGALVLLKCEGVSKWGEGNLERRISALDGAAELKAHCLETNEMVGSVSFKQYLRLYRRLGSIDDVKQVVEELGEDIRFPKELWSRVKTFMRHFDNTDSLEAALELTLRSKEFRGSRDRRTPNVEELLSDLED